MTLGEPDIAAMFRVEWPRLVARLIRDLRDVGLAEDSAQDAFVEAARRWPETGLPDAPGAWLLTTARRKAIDHLRRSQRQWAYVDALASATATRAEPDASAMTDDLGDEQLAVLLGCCHPALSPDAQVALTLRLVAGLSSVQIARAFLVSESTMTRRLTRAKTKIRGANIPFARSDIDTLHERLPAVCAVVYSTFTEGHASARATTLIRGDLCDEALWLGRLLHDLIPDDPEVAGLLALMQLTDARRATRVSAGGRPILLAHQDRSRWDQDKIAAGLGHLRSASGRHQPGPYQLQAAIAAVHSTAPSFEATDWSAIIGVYDVLLRRQQSPVLGLNRAIAIGQRDGPTAGLAALEQLDLTMPFAEELQSYPYFHAARAEFLAAVHRIDEAAAAFTDAASTSTNAAEHGHLDARIREIRTGCVWEH